jgi:hypothetical protein
MKHKMQKKKKKTENKHLARTDLYEEEFVPSLRYPGKQNRLLLGRQFLVAGCRRAKNLSDP